ncbi:GNAT family N-acetyltransferase [Sutcliffiella cohnii]
MNIFIREEQTQDYKNVEQVIKSAFANVSISDQTEHNLVANIRNSGAYIRELSLVAIDKDTEQIVGHILYSKIAIINEEHSIESLALAPVSVIPTYQKKGVGKLLIEESLRIASKQGYESVIVLGHPNYYPKFGFQKASRWGIKAPFHVPDEVFMALELKKDALKNVSGVVEYSKAFL